MQICQLRMRSCTNTHFKVQSNQLSPGLLHMVRADAYWHIIGSIYACVFAGQMKLFINSCRPISFSSFSCLCFVLLLVCLFAFFISKASISVSNSLLPYVDVMLVESHFDIFQSLRILILPLDIFSAHLYISCLMNFNSSRRTCA